MIIETILISAIIGTSGVLGSYFLYKKKQEMDASQQVALFYDNESIQDAVEYYPEE